MRCEGFTGNITVDGHTLVVDRDTRLGRITFGKDLDPRRIPLRAVSGAALSPATRLTNGALLLMLGGSTDLPMPGSTKQASHPDVVVFTHKQRHSFEELHRWLLTVAAANHNLGQGFPQAPAGPVARLEAKTAALRHRADELELERQQLLDDRGEARVEAEKSKAAKLEESGLRPDIAAAAARVGSTFGGKREINHLHEHLLPGETVEHLAKGKYESELGIVALTNQRLLFVFHGVIRSRTEDFPIPVISSVQSKSGFVFSEMTIHASGNRAVIGEMLAADAAAITDAVRRKIAEFRQPSPALPAFSPVPPPVDPVDQIKRLAELRDAGILSESEFETKKQELLGRM
ncbi:SHOCT domain-containing protein [Nocardia salmonicida]|uniref:SHOCT domain-containing protein n=1 Tax=Nocardia salmonicida TaxID=53431 RepID=UPI0033CF23F3